MQIPTLVLLTVNDNGTDTILEAFPPEGHESRGKVTCALLSEVAGLRLVHTISEMCSGSVGAAQQRSREAARNAVRVSKAAHELEPLCTPSLTTRRGEPTTCALATWREKLARLFETKAIEDDAARRFKVELEGAG